MKHSILLVEDDVSHERLIRNTLEMEGHTVESIGSLHEALDFLNGANLAVEVVILDLELPDHRTGDTVEIVRANTTLPIIVHSGAEGAEREDAVANGAMVFIPKGGPAEHLVAAVNAACNDLGLTEHPIPAVDSTLVGTRDFQSLANYVVTELAGACDVPSWLVTRVVDDEWIVLAAHDPVFGIEAGDVLRWSDSVCARMTNGLGPNLVADIGEVAPYRSAPIVERSGIGCYVGFPLAVDSTGLFGTLCGIGPTPHGDSSVLAAKEPFFRLMTRALASTLAVDLERARLARRLEVADAATRADALTGLGNRRAFTRAMRTEDLRCDRFGHPAAVVMIDLDGLKTINDGDGHDAGDRLIRLAADVLQSMTREVDQVFRVGGDEFVLLLPEVDGPHVDAIYGRIKEAFAKVDIEASVGVATRPHIGGLDAALRSADEAMYRDKRG